MLTLHQTDNLPPHPPMKTISDGASVHTQERLRWRDFCDNEKLHRDNPHFDIWVLTIYRLAFRGGMKSYLVNSAKRYSVAAELIDCSRVLDCANKIKFCCLSRIVLNNNFIFVFNSFWFVEV